MFFKRIDPQLLKQRILYRDLESHKGTYGHLLLVSGSKSMPGAAILATGGALRSGCGLVTVHSSPSVCHAISCSFPSAMLSFDKSDCFTSFPSHLEKYSVIAVGPGLGQSEDTVIALSKLIDRCNQNNIRMALDADALTIIASRPNLLNELPTGSVITPHDGELKRLFNCDWTAYSEKEKLCSDFSQKYNVVIVSKGYNTKIYSPAAGHFENTTGNPGMAKGGSGDVLLGLISGLMARGYDTLTASLMGVWIHGYSGDCLTSAKTAEAYDSREIIDHLYEGFMAIQS